MTKKLKISDEKKLEVPIEENAGEEPTENVDVKEPVLKRGTKGTPFNSVTNAIRVHCVKDYGMFEYDTRFVPSIDSMQARKDILRHKMADTIGSIYNYDGGETLYLPIKLPSKVVKKTLDNDQMVQITFRRARSLNECTHFYNVLFDRIMNVLKFERIGRKYFDPVAPKLIPQHKLQIWPGYVKVVEELEDGLMLTLDVSHRVLNQRTVYEFLQECMQKSGGNWRDSFKKGIIGNVVLTR